MEITGNNQEIEGLRKIDPIFIAKVRKELRTKTTRRGATLLGLQNETERVNKFLMCNFSDRNMIPDFREGALHYNEYVDCGQRGHCPAEGLFCKLPGKLSPREMQYAMLVAGGMADKQAADAMGVSENTVHGFRRSIQLKLKAHSKLDIVRWATMIAPERFINTIS